MSKPDYLRKVLGDYLWSVTFSVWQQCTSLHPPCSSYLSHMSHGDEPQSRSNAGITTVRRLRARPIQLRKEKLSHTLQRWARSESYRAAIRGPPFPGPPTWWTAFTWPPGSARGSTRPGGASSARGGPPAPPRPWIPKCPALATCSLLAGTDSRTSGRPGWGRSSAPIPSSRRPGGASSTSMGSTLAEGDRKANEALGPSSPPMRSSPSPSSSG